MKKSTLKPTWNHVWNYNLDEAPDNNVLITMEQPRFAGLDGKPKLYVGTARHEKDGDKHSWDEIEAEDGGFSMERGGDKVIAWMPMPPPAPSPGNAKFAKFARVPMKLQSPTGKDIIGTQEAVPGTAGINNSDVTLNKKTGQYDFDNDGDTEVAWDEQTTEMHLGQRTFVASDGTLWLERELLLVPE